MDNRVQPILLPKTEMKRKDKEKCRVAGWGHMKSGGKRVDVLQVADVPIINLEVCKKELSHAGVTLPENVICAGGYGTKKGFCQVCFMSIYRKWFLILKWYKHL